MSSATEKSSSSNAANKVTISPEEVDKFMRIKLGSSYSILKSCPKEVYDKEFSFAYNELKEAKERQLAWKEESEENVWINVLDSGWISYNK